MKKREMIKTILNALRTYEIEPLIEVSEDDTPVKVMYKIEDTFDMFSKKQLTPLYKDAKFRLRYKDVGLIS
jgi:hypothetical protein